MSACDGYENPKQLLSVQACLTGEDTALRLCTLLRFFILVLLCVES